MEAGENEEAGCAGTAAKVTQSASESHQQTGALRSNVANVVLLAVGLSNI